MRTKRRKTYRITRTELGLLALVLFLLVYALGVTQMWLSEKARAAAFTSFMERPVLPPSHFILTNNVSSP